jgi:branched-chain amino acid transport system permease protein
MNIITLISTHRKSLVLGVLLLILVLLATAPLYVARGSHIVVMTDLLMYVILTVSWVMFCGPTRYMSLATAAFFGIGTYASAFLYAKGAILLPLPAVIIIGGLVSFCAALIIGASTLRLKGTYFAIFSFGITELVRQLLQYYELQYTGTRGRFVSFIEADSSYYIALIIFVAVMVTAYLIKRSKYGLALAGIGEHEEAAAHMGVNVNRVKVLTFGLSAFFIGAIGAAMAPRFAYVDPTTAFNVNYNFIPALMALLGGMGQLYAPVIGALGLGYLRYILLTRAPYQYMLILGITLVVVIVFLPGGLASLIERVRHRLWAVILKLGKGGEAEQHANT